MGVCESRVMSKYKLVSFAMATREPKKVRLEMVYRRLGSFFSFITWWIQVLRHLHWWFSRNVWVYFLKRKSDVFSTFKKWKVEVENQIDLRTEHTRSKNGEYEKSKFTAFYAIKEIIFIRIVSSNEDNTAKKMNKTLNEREMSLEIHYRLPKIF